MKTLFLIALFAAPLCGAAPTLDQWLPKELMAEKKEKASSDRASFEPIGSTKVHILPFAFWDSLAIDVAVVPILRVNGESFAEVFYLIIVRVQSGQEIFEWVSDPVDENGRQHEPASIGKPKPEPEKKKKKLPDGGLLPA